MKEIFRGIKLSMSSLFDLLNFAFSKDTSLYDKTVTDVIFSDSKNKKILLDALKNNTGDSIEIRITHDKKVEIVNNKTEVVAE
jgi:hypothetical protein